MANLITVEGVRHGPHLMSTLTHDGGDIRSPSHGRPVRHIKQEYDHEQHLR